MLSQKIQSNNQTKIFKSTANKLAAINILSFATNLLEVPQCFRKCDRWAEVCFHSLHKSMLNCYNSIKFMNEIPT